MTNISADEFVFEDEKQNEYSIQKEALCQMMLVKRNLRIIWTEEAGTEVFNSEK
ncbi:hypothetical protein ACN6KJ_03535 [Enterococcus faecium]